MHDLYQILGVSTDASGRAIKRAYRERALSEHPDKGGDAERMALLTTAYETLSDPDERKKYDQEWEIFNASYDTETFLTPDGYLPVAGVAFSKAFRQIRDQLVIQYTQEPLEEISSPLLKPFRCELYSGAADLFSFIKAKRNSKTKVDMGSLTPEKGVEYFINFLRGEYSRNCLREISRAFYKKIKEIETLGQLPDFNLYCGIYNIFLVAVKEKTPSETILLSLIKITDYAKQKVESMSFMASLFQSKYFRCLFSQALHYYWLSEENALEESYVKSFNGLSATEDWIERLKSQLSESRSASKSNDNVARSLRRVRLFLKLEHDLQRRTNQSDRAHFYREKAFHLLDWVPCLKGIADTAIVVNTLLQIGITFLKAAAQESNAALRMADQKLATQIYAIAVGIAHHATPDIELYAHVHSVKCLSSCRYMDSELKEIVEAFQHRALWIADLFPFFQTPLANADFIAKEDNLELMRLLLHALVDRIDGEKVSLEIDHSHLRVFYQAFEASLKNWFDKNHDTEREKRYRQRLMEELLKSKKWSTNDVDYNLNAPWPLADLDEQGWTCPKSSILTSAKKKDSPTCKTIFGAEINYKTGHIDFVFEYCKPDEKDYNRLLTPFDVMELIQRRLISAIFSLDPVDPDMPYHPFNKMRFAPSTLYHSQLLHTMFITDYLLKFLTAGQEVQRHHPYELRSLERVMAALPDRLRKVVCDFHNSNCKESLNRFWIESEAVELAIDGEGDAVTLALGSMRMVVKHRKMERDAEGNLVDKEGEGEGWDVYVFSKQQKRELYNGERVIADSALIVETDSWELFFWEYNKASHSFTLKEYKWSLILLSRLQRDSQEKILTENSDSLSQVHRIVLKACQKTGVPHRYSPEFIFAQEFTKHYDEFAVYLPEFGRLRELSKAAALVKIMVAQREANQEEIRLIKRRLDYYKTICAVQTKKWFTVIVNEPARIKEHSYWYSKRSELNELINKGIFEQFREWHGKFSKEKLDEKRQEQLNDIRRQIGTIHFTRHSPEIKEICDDNYNRIKNDIISKHGYSGWNSVSHRVYAEAIEPNIPTIISKVKAQKKAACQEQLLKLFKEELNNVSGRGHAIDSFLEGSNQSLREHLVQYDKIEVAKKIKEIYPEHTINTLDRAVNNSASAILEVVNCEIEKALKKHEECLKEHLSGREKLEQSFSDLGFELRTEEVDLEGSCSWVPASFRHDVEGSHSRTVYGGVVILGMIRDCINPKDKAAFLRQTREDARRLQRSRMGGNAIQNFYAQHVVSHQYPISEFEVLTEVRWKDTPQGGRRTDIIVKCRKTGDFIKAYEIKVNNSPYVPKQRNNDDWLYKTGKIKSPVELLTIKFSLDWFDDL